MLARSALESFLFVFALSALSQAACGQTPADVTKWIERLVELDSMDLAKEVKYRPGLQPSLHAIDADVSAKTR